MNYINYISKIRKQKRLKQKELAEKAGIDTSYLSSLENGKRDATLGYYRKIAAALEVPLRDLLEDYDTNAPRPKRYQNLINYLIQNKITPCEFARMNYLSSTGQYPLSLIMVGSLTLDDLDEKGLENGIQLLDHFCLEHNIEIIKDDNKTK